MSAALLNRRCCDVIKAANSCPAWGLCGGGGSSGAGGVGWTEEHRYLIKEVKCVFIQLTTD